jgi:hypothetical protein
MATSNQIEIKKFITPEIKKKLNSWEKQFISSLYNKKTNWSDKQVEVFEKIKIKYAIQEKKVVEKIIYLPTGYAKGAKVSQDITTRKQRKNRALPKWKNN